MIVLKILGIVLGAFIASVWLGVVISAGVSLGLEKYFDKHSEKN